MKDNELIAYASDTIIFSDLTIKDDVVSNKIREWGGKGWFVCQISTHIVKDFHIVVVLHLTNSEPNVKGYNYF